MSEEGAEEIPFFNVKHKLILLGDSHVGKTSYLSRLVKSTFQNNIRPTVGSAYLQYRKVIDDKEHIFMIWDTAGEEKFRSMMPLYSQGAVGAIIVFDLSSKESFSDVPEWISVARAEGDIPLLLLGNKYDLERNVSDDEINKFSIERNIPFCECSALTGYGVQESFAEIANLILQYEQNKRTQQVQLPELNSTSSGYCC